MQGFADFAAQHIGQAEAEALAQEFNEGFWTKEFTMRLYRADLSPAPKEKEDWPRSSYHHP